MCQNAVPELMIPAVSAVLSGSVFGDHCSPISDSTILSSTGAGCNHIDHVSTQLPYAFCTAAACCAAFIAIGITKNLFLSYILAFTVLGMIFFLKMFLKTFLKKICR
jgi:Na+/H+ antiporter NhaC